MAQERVSTHTLVRAEDCINVNTARRSHNEKGQRMSSGNSHSSESVSLLQSPIFEAILSAARLEPILGVLGVVVANMPHSTSS